MNKNVIVVFDFETGGLVPGENAADPERKEVIQVAGKAYDPRTLEPYPVEMGGEFSSLMKPLYFDRLEPKALECNKKTVAELEKAPDQGVVWMQFVEWVKKWNKGKAPWGCPIAAGKNIIDFDLKFVTVLNELYHPKGKNAAIFNRKKLDLEDPIFLWFENEEEPAKANMDCLREFFGMSTEGAHDAMVDVKQTGALLMKFLKLSRSLQKKMVTDKETGKPKRFIQFKGCFAGQGV